LAEYEVSKILEYKRRHPSMEPAQLRAQLKRFEGWRLSIKAIARVLTQNGYQLVHRGSRPTGPEPVRFEAPRRNALWQLDFAELHVEGLRLHLLVVLDDFSRFVVGHTLADSCSSEVVVATLGAAIARHGKPEAVRTDRGGAFTSGELGRYLEAELIDHVVGRSYHPQGGGKVESIIGTVRRELWDVEHMEDRGAAERRLVSFFEEYNERRAHLGIDGLTPADRFFGRADRVLAAIDALSRHRQGSLALLSRQGDPVEELSGPHSRAPLEVLRLVVVNGEVELRFCGARVRLGSIEV
jgi:transposase InsO family protein